MRVIRNKGSHGVDGMKIDELRECIKKHWKKPKSKYKNPIKLGIPKYIAWECVNTRKGYNTAIIKNYVDNYKN